MLGHIGASGGGGRITEGNQLKRDLLELSEALGDGVSWRRVNSSPLTVMEDVSRARGIAEPIDPGSLHTGLVLLLYDANH